MPNTCFFLCNMYKSVLFNIRTYSYYRVKVIERTLLHQIVRAWQSRSGVLIFLIGVFHVVVSLQSSSNVTGIVAVSTTKWLQSQIQTNWMQCIKTNWTRIITKILRAVAGSWVCAGVYPDLKIHMLFHVSDQGWFRDRGEVALRALKPLPWRKHRIPSINDAGVATCVMIKKEQRIHTFIWVAQSVAFQRHFGFELLATQIAEMTPLCVVSVHMSLQVTPTAARVVTHTAGVRL